jgi:transposase
MPRTTKYPEALLGRGARMVFDSGRPIAHVARDLGVNHETLRKWGGGPKPMKESARSC